MTEETGKGAWRMRATIDGNRESGWERYWDPEAEPLNETEVASRRARLLEILFAPRPDDPQ